MKYLLVFILLYVSNSLVFSQYSEVFKQLPKKYQNGIIAYKHNDTTLLVFKALDYNNLFLDGIEYVSNSKKPIFKIADKIYDAHNNEITIIKAGQYENFPNIHTLRRLFSKNKIFLFTMNNQTGFYKKKKIKLKNNRKTGFVNVYIKKHSKPILSLNYKRVN